MIVTAPERTILEALVVSPDLPKIQARAQVVLRVAEGLDDDLIAAELLMRRQDVRHWKNRFEAQGVRGLWDSPGPGAKKQVSPEKESAVLRDVFYGRAWSTKLLAKKYGLSIAAISRIFAKHGIVRDRWLSVDIRHLKVFADPLFGATVSGISALYYGIFGVLALVTSSRAFPELNLLVPIRQTCKRSRYFSRNFRPP